MNNLKAIRKHIKLTQAELGKMIGCTQGNIGHYERGGQNLGIEVAKKILAVAKEHGLETSLEYLYGTVNYKTVERDQNHKIELLFDAFGGQHIMVNGRSFITINYLAQYIDNAGMRNLTNNILKLLEPVSCAGEQHGNG